MSSEEGFNLATPLEVTTVTLSGVASCTCKFGYMYSLKKKPLTKDVQTKPFKKINAIKNEVCEMRNKPVSRKFPQNNIKNLQSFLRSVSLTSLKKLA